MQPSQEKKLKEAFTETQKRDSFYTRIAGTPATMASKMVEGDTTQSAIKDEDVLGNLGIQNPFVQNSLSASMERITDNGNILQLLPDIRLSMDLIVGGVLYPKDGMTTELTYVSTNSAFDQKSQPLLDHVAKYFTSQYKLKDFLYPMLMDIVAKTGSYPIAVLPETSIDYVINSDVSISSESLVGNLYNEDKKSLKTFGFISPFKNKNHKNEIGENEDFLSYGNEDLDPLALLKQLNESPKKNDTSKHDFSIGHSDFLLTITDNFDVLKMPDVNRKILMQETQRLVDDARIGSRRNESGMISDLTFSNESMVSIDEEEAKEKVENIKRLQNVYKKRQYKSRAIQRIKPRTAIKRKNIGHPFDCKMPTEAVIPVHSPGDPSDHVAYLILLDQTGHPIRMAELENIHQNLISRSNSGSNMTSTVLNNMVQAQGFPQDQTTSLNQTIQAYEAAVPIYTQIVERDLLDRMERGRAGTGFSLGRQNAAYRIMLARAMQNKRTQVLYLPAPLMAYMANEYDQFGLGKTLLDDSKTIAALRSIALFIGSMANAKNAITKRNVKVHLSDAEKNPQKAQEIILHEIAKGTQASYPLTNNPADIINHFQAAGANIEFDDHPRLPNTSVNMEYQRNEYNKVETDYDDWLKKIHTMSFGLTPDLLDSASHPDFATQVIFSNILTQRKIKGVSDAFAKSLSMFVQKYVFNSDILMTELEELIDANKIRFKDQFGKTMSSSEVVDSFVESLTVELPQPDTESVKANTEAFNSYFEMIEKAIPMFISPEFMTEEELGKIGGQETIEKTAKFMESYFMRDWMHKNGIGAELFDMVSMGSDGKPMVDAMSIKDQFMNAYSQFAVHFKGKSEKRASDNDKRLEQIEKKLGIEPPPEDDMGGDYGSGSDYGDNPDDGNDFNFDEPEGEGEGENTDEVTETTEETNEEEGKEKTDEEE